MPEGSGLPQKIGHYDVKRLLATGTMGDVYQATTMDERTRAPIYHAIKVLNPKVAKRLDYVQRFKSEIRDDCIQDYVEIDYDQKVQYYFVCHYLEVKPISRAVLRRERSGEILEIFARVCRALEKAHQKKYVHGNIKPSNLLIRRGKDETGKEAVTPILSDFGLGYVYLPEYFTGARFRSVFPYMAPERIDALVAGEEKSSLTPANDVYSLGAVLAETLSGAIPFGDSDGLDSLKKAKSARRYMLLHVNHPIRRVDIKLLNEVVKRCLDPDPRNRYASCAELANALSGCIVSSPTKK